MTARVMTMLGELIACPSVSSVRPELDQGNRAVTDLLANWLDDLGFAIELMPLPGQPHKTNLIATLGTGRGGLVLAGHTDTVPCDESRWCHDPWKVTASDGRLYGLGTSDMKSFFALAVEAIRRLPRQRPARPLTILATADEESGMAGARALLQSWRPTASHAVIGEPTGLRPVHRHKGMMMEAIRLTGQSGHSSDPALGSNALEAMHDVITELLAWRRELAAKHRDELFAVPVPTLNLGHIHGGDNPNRICGDCELLIDLRPLPGMDIDELRAMLRTRVKHALRKRSIAWETVSLTQGTPALATDPDAAIVRSAEQLTGEHSRGVSFSTEGPYLTRLGMETVILGPGDIAQAHQADEYLAQNRIEPTVTLLTGLIHRFCMQPHGGPAGNQGASAGG